MHTVQMAELNASHEKAVKEQTNQIEKFIVQVCETQLMSKHCVMDPTCFGKLRQ